ncbi:hypothetical protein Tco_0782841 [Tanacetum coccineum]
MSVEEKRVLPRIHIPSYQEKVMAVLAILVSADSFKGSFRDTIDIATVVMTLAQHGEAIRGIHEHLLKVPIHEELRALRDRVDVAEVESASLRATIRMMGAVKPVLRNRMRDERQTRIKIERQLASIQESNRQDRKDFKKLKDFITSQYGYLCID